MTNEAVQNVSTIKDPSERHLEVRKEVKENSEKLLSGVTSESHESSFETVEHLGAKDTVAERRLSDIDSSSRSSTSSSIHTDSEDDKGIVNVPPVLRKHDLSKRNSDFADNPYFPDYLRRRTKVVDYDIRNESGIELDYINDQRDQKPPRLKEITANMGKPINFGAKFDRHPPISPLDYQKQQAEKAVNALNKQKKKKINMVDRLRFLKMLKNIDQNKPRTARQAGIYSPQPRHNCGSGKYSCKFCQYVSDLPKIRK